MANFNRRKRHFTTFMFDHNSLRVGIEYVGCLCICLISASLFSFGFSAFITGYDGVPNLVTGGLSGFSQNLVLILELCGLKNLPFSTMQSIVYFVINIPIIIFAFVKISTRFAVCSAINVGLSSLFIFLFGQAGVGQAIASSTYLTTSPLSRAIFAGLCSGVSAALCFNFDITAGGFDVISYYLSKKKSTGAGKIGTTFSCFVITLYAILTIAQDPSAWDDHLIIIFFSIAYLFIVGIVTDVVNIKNKKFEIKIITANQSMSDILISLYPHSMTIVDGRGAFSHKEKLVMFLIVSSSEVREIVATIKKIDPDAFVTTTQINKVYGNFFTKPIE